jgi:hypothetical protein
MDNSTSNNLAKTLTETIPNDLSSFEPDVDTNVSGDSESSIFSKFSTWIFIILILAFLGFNVFIYLAKGTQTFTEFLAPYLNYIGITAFNTTKQVIDTSAKGLNEAGNIVETELKRNTMDQQQIFKQLDNKTNNLGTTNYDYKKENDDDECVIPKKNNLMKALDNAAQTTDYMADDALSSIQQQSKTKWCYIGEEKGVRNCVRLSESQKCMSGDIFPSSNICINPNLRSGGK